MSTLINKNETGLLFVLYSIQLEVAKHGHKYVLTHLNRQKKLLGQTIKKLGLIGPELCHQYLLTILDSPLNEAICY